MKSFENVISAVYNSPWLITQEGLETVAAIVERKVNGEEISLEQLAELREKNEERTRLKLPDEPGIAVLPIQGTIFPKANLLTEFSGGTSMEKFISDLEMLMEEDNVKGILLDIDSPGGSVPMVQEGADAIWEAVQSKKKPVWATANSTAASAAYYLGSQAEKLFMTPSGVVGSVGVVGFHTDQTAKNEKEGIKRTILRVGENKYLGSPDEPLDDKTKQIKLEEMTEIYTDFVNTVARGRGVTADEVMENYGKGRVYKSRSALEKGMIDGIKTIGSVSNMFVDEVFKTPIRSKLVPQEKGVKMPEISPETLEALGLSEDATSEDVQNAVTALRGAANAKPEDDLDIPADFAKQFPEQARLMAELQLGRRQDAAKMFAQEYERFSTEEGSETGFGFSGLALTQVEELHLKIADGIVTHEDLKNLLDNVASGAAVVDYRELGSKRGKENDTPDNAMEAGAQLRTLAENLRKESDEQISFGDALSKVMADPDHQSLVQMYRSANKPVINSGGDDS